MTLQITAIPAFQDNYLWLIDNGQSAVVVDPGDATPVLETLVQKNLSLEAILITHHHADHTGGITQLLKHSDVPVIGPESQHIPQVTQIVTDQKQVTLLGQIATVIAVPGHTLDHIAYFFSELETPSLFCGDTLFAGGCGRVFEGTHAQMRSSLAKLKNLPPETHIYCAHEYTQSNLAFAQAVEPGNPQLINRVAQVNALRAKKQATVPSTIKIELATNPFLRFNEPNVTSIAQQRSGKTLSSQDEVFAVIRQWKDNF